MHEDSLTTRAEFVKVGQASWDTGLNSLKSGNISLLLHDGNILITRTGRSMRGLDPVRDLISIGREETRRGDASCEFYVHRGIYAAAGDSNRGAIVHCHGPCTIAATCVWDDHIPSSFNEAEDVLGSTRILESRRRESYGEDPERIADALKDAKIVAVRGHGTFTLAETLEECLYLTHLLETSCRISFMVSSALNGKSKGR